jgi:glutaminyl-peptide cyclotransferase
MGIRGPYVSAMVAWAASTLGVGIVSGHATQPQKGIGVEQLRVEVLKTYTHDRTAFTQGLVLHDGKLLESTGLVGKSSLREVELETGRVIRRVEVAPPIFAEGLALVGDELIQLSWQDGKALRYDRRSFAPRGEFPYRGEGWGLCYDGKALVMSDGSANLTIRNPSDFTVIRVVTVTLDDRPFPQLNELECVEGSIYANVWMRDLIVRIDPTTGRVTQQIAVPPLLSPMERQGTDVLNGIAYDAATKTFLITGKLWPKLFRVRFVR